MLLLRVLFLLPLVIHAQPGSLLPSTFPPPSCHALVHATAIADDGSTYLSGDFTEIDGVARPGLAKLTSTGILDPSFTPAATTSNDLYSLPTSHLMSIAHNSWKLLNADGSPNTDLLADIARTSVPRPQFHTEDHLYVIVGSSLHSYHTANLARDISFVSPVTTHPPHQVVPAADSKLWLLTRSPSQPSPLFYNSDFSHTLLRILENGNVDPAFLPVELPADHAYSLESAPSGSFRLIGEWLGRYLYWPRPTARHFTADRYSPFGEKIATQSYAAPFSWIGEVLFQDPDLVIYPTLDSTRLVRRQAASQTSDPAFAVPIAAPHDPISGSIRAVTLDPLPEGKFLLGGTRRFLADGDPDPFWHIPRLEKNATITRLHRLPGGSVLATGDFDLADQAPAPGILKVRIDDSPDPAFAPSFDFRFAKKVIPFPDGTLLALFSVNAIDPSGRAAPLARFSANGEFLSLWPIPEPPGSPTLYMGEATDIAIQSDGTTLVSTFSNGEVPTPGFRRILPDGTSPLVPGNLLVPDTAGPLLLLHNDSYLRGNTHYAADGTILETIPTNLTPLTQLHDRSVIFARQYYSTTDPALIKWHPLNGIDPDFEDPFSGEPNTRIASITPASYGKIFLLKGNSLVRLHATGQLDPTFRPPAATIHAAVAEPGGSILIAGNFTSLDGLTRLGIARLDDTRAVGFDEWIAAATARSEFTDLSPNADPDLDGISNFLEYAAATDPSAPTPSQPTRVAALTWMTPCNPEAPEITRRLETSSELNSWLPARADQVRLETHQHCFTWSLLPGSSKLFSRVIVE